jgi:hypothetical protein
MEVLPFYLTCDISAKKTYKHSFHTFNFHCWNSGQTHSSTLYKNVHVQYIHVHLRSHYLSIKRSTRFRPRNQLNLVVNMALRPVNQQSGPSCSKKFCHYLGVKTILVLNQLDLTEGFNVKLVT